ncbi:MAG TPA: hypothetical protein VKA40_05185 [Nitrososphaera sp.]|nr:hypothetical protein [Nitrososphaera sp.]
MNSNNIINHSKDRTKATAAIPMVGAIVTAALLLSGLSLISSSYQPAIAQQQDMTTGGGGGATTYSGTEGGTTGGATPQGGNATTTAGGAGGGENDSLSQIRMHVEEARTALQNNDTHGVMMHLDLIYNAVGGAGVLEVSNMTAIDTTAAGNATNMTAAGNATTGGTEGGGVLEGIF